jgi:hypothetical protein
VSPEIAFPHDCCNRCQSSCKCEGESCSKEFLFEKVEVVENISRMRDVSDNDKLCLREALQEIQLALDSSSGFTLFDVSGRIAHGFSDSIINSIVEKSNHIFTICDLMEYACISSINIAIMVLEVLNEIFEDIFIDDNLYKLAVLSGPVYNTVIDGSYTDNTSDAAD